MFISQAQISPIMLVPKELEFAAVQELYYIQEARMRSRSPLISKERTIYDLWRI